MNETVYLQIKQNIELDHQDVRLSDVADIYATNGNVAAKLKSLQLVHIKETKAEKLCFSIMKVIEIVNKEYPGITVNNMGETDFVVDYIPKKKHSKTLQTLLITLVCIITAVGSAYGIMAYNNDVSTQEIFEKVYEMLGTTPEKENMAMEIAYAIGLASGIIIFYNHFGKKRFTNEPTPMEVEMDKYDTDISTALSNRRDAVGKEKK